MNERVSQAREALLAELLGDSTRLIESLGELRLDLTKADAGARETADALRQATATYREQQNDMLARTRLEFAAMLSTAAERHARNLVGQQTEVLQKAAVAAVRSALSAEAIRRTRRDWLVLAAVCSSVGALAATAVVVVALRLV